MDISGIDELLRHVGGTPRGGRHGPQRRAYDKLIAKVAEPDFPLGLLPPYQSSNDDGYRQHVAELAVSYSGWLPEATRSESAQ